MSAQGQHRGIDRQRRLLRQVGSAPDGAVPFTSFGFLSSCLDRGTRRSAAPHTVPVRVGPLDWTTTMLGVLISLVAGRAGALTAEMAAVFISGTAGPLNADRA